MQQLRRRTERLEGNDRWSRRQLRRVALLTGLCLALSPALVAQSSWRSLTSPRGEGALLKADHARVPRPVKPLSSKRRVLGLFVRGALGSFTKVNQFASTAKIYPRTISAYVYWGGPFDVTFADHCAYHGAVPLMQLEPEDVTLQSIAKGKSDRWLRSYAEAVKKWGDPVMIGFAAEPDGKWAPWGERFQSPAEWVAADRHVIDVFRAVGAKNVKFLWTMNEMKKPALIRKYWPGRSFMQWVGIDGYIATPKDTFNSVFRATIQLVRKMAPHAPILLSEVGVNTKANQIRGLKSLFSGIRKDRLAGLLYFDVNQPDHAHYWRIEGHPGSIRTFRAGLKLIGVPR